MENVFSFYQAIEEGHQPRDYPFDIDIPQGSYNVLLDFKIWGKKTMGVVCYFSMRESGRKFNLTVFRQENKEYQIKGCDIDFRECPAPAHYRSLSRKIKKAIRFSAMQYCCCNLVRDDFHKMLTIEILHLLF